MEQYLIVGNQKDWSYGLAEKDKQLLCDIGQELNMVEVIKFRKKNKPNEQNKYSLTVNSTKMCNDLITLGSWTK